MMYLTHELKKLADRYQRRLDRRVSEDARSLPIRTLPQWEDNKVRRSARLQRIRRMRRAVPPKCG